MDTKMKYALADPNDYANDKFTSTKSINVKKGDIIKHDGKNAYVIEVNLSDEKDQSYSLCRELITGTAYRLYNIPNQYVQRRDGEPVSLKLNSSYGSDV